MQDVVRRIAAITDQEFAFTRGQFRTWVSSNLIPATEIRGEGLSTRRSYDNEAIFIGAALVRVSQMGIQGPELREKVESLRDAWAILTANPASGEAVYYIGAVGKSPGLVSSTFVSEPSADKVLRDFEGGAAFVIHVSGLFALASG